MIELYTRANCSLCLECKKTLADNNIQYAEVRVDVDIKPAEVVAKFPGAKTLPVISVNGTMLGGCEELVNIVKSDQLKYL